MVKFRKGRRTLAIIIVFLMSQMGPAADSPYKEDGLPIAKRGNHRSVTCQRWNWGGVIVVLAVLSYFHHVVDSSGFINKVRRAGMNFR